METRFVVLIAPAALDARFLAGPYGSDADRVHPAEEVHTRRDRWHIDELALRFQGTKDKKIIAQTPP
jgi:hypothetical protein